MEPKDLAEVSELTEEEARQYIERIRWPGGPACPRCGDTAVTLLQGESTRPGVYKCKGCRKPFTVTVGTIFEDSHIPLRKWVLCFWLMCSSKKGISAKQLQRNLGLKSYKSAWHMAHRIRHAMRHEPLRSMLKGTVEVDETYVGGKPRRLLGYAERRRLRSEGIPYRKHSTKVPVVVLVERNGQARARALERVNAETLQGAIREHVDRSSRIMTDEHGGYIGIGEEYAGGHHTTNHGLGEYLRGDVHSNTAESFFAILKRSVHGIHHHVSKQHLPRYLDERAFVWNGRKLTDAERTVLALQKTEGKRLMYQETRPS
jgi:transposase-like protein